MAVQCQQIVQVSFLVQEERAKRDEAGTLSEVKTGKLDDRYIFHVKLLEVKNVEGAHYFSEELIQQRTFGAGSYIFLGPTMPIRPFLFQAFQQMEQRWQTSLQEESASWHASQCLVYNYEITIDYISCRHARRLGITI